MSLPDCPGTPTRCCRSPVRWGKAPPATGFARRRRTVRAHPDRLIGDTIIGRTVFQEAFAERTLWRRVEPATIPLLYEASLDDVTVAYIPGVYGELFDGELWTRGLRALHDRLGVR